MQQGEDRERRPSRFEIEYEVQRVERAEPRVGQERSAESGAGVPQNVQAGGGDEGLAGQELGCAAGHGPERIGEEEAAERGQEQGGHGRGGQVGPLPRKTGRLRPAGSLVQWLGHAFRSAFQAREVAAQTVQALADLVFAGGVGKADVALGVGPEVDAGRDPHQRILQEVA